MDRNWQTDTETEWTFILKNVHREFDIFWWTSTCTRAQVSLWVKLSHVLYGPWTERLTSISNAVSCWWQLWNVGADVDSAQFVCCSILSFVTQSGQHFYHVLVPGVTRLHAAISLWISSVSLKLSGNIFQWEKKKPFWKWFYRTTCLNVSEDGMKCCSCKNTGRRKLSQV